MSNNNIPIVKPIDEKVFNFKQSKYPNVPKVPFRSIVLGPSGSGKSVLLVSLVLDIYKDVFERVYVFSPSINHDSIWEPVKKYVKDKLKVDTDKEPCFFEDYHSYDLIKIIETQIKVTKFMKEQKQKNLYNILIILDDIADSPEIARNNKMLQSLYVRGRHAGISVITATQKFNILHPVIRVNATQLFVFRLRNYKEMEALLEELSGLVPRKTLLEIYNTAIEEEHNFLYVDLMKKNANEMFFKNFTHSIRVDDYDEDM